LMKSFPYFSDPLHYCAHVGFIDGAKVLLDAGAKINTETRLK
jgi:hypothetical protein